MLIAKASILDRTNAEEVEQYNKLKRELIDLTYPELKQKRAEDSQDLESTFNMLFRDKEGKPKPIKVEIGDAYGKEFEAKDYLKTVKKK